MGINSGFKGLMVILWWRYIPVWQHPSIPVLHLAAK